MIGLIELQVSSKYEVWDHFDIYHLNREHSVLWPTFTVKFTVQFTSSCLKFFTLTLLVALATNISCDHDPHEHQCYCYYEFGQTDHGFMIMIIRCGVLAMEVLWETWRDILAKWSSSSWSKLAYNNPDDQITCVRLLFPLLASGARGAERAVRIWNVQVKLLSVNLSFLKSLSFPLSKKRMMLRARGKTT